MDVMSVQQSSLHKRLRILSHSVMHQTSVLFPGEVDEGSFEGGCVLKLLSQSPPLRWMLSASAQFSAWAPPKFF